MAATQPVSKRQSTEVQTRRDREEELALAPPVDIFEDAHGITVQAEMPGVSKDRLNVQADRNSLLIEGEAAIDMPAGMKALYADVQATKYRRSFVLSGELETERIEANLKDGVLTVRIPKRAEFRPRKIEVRAA
jgi:HSP20 family protein